MGDALGDCTGFLFADPKDQEHTQYHIRLGEVNLHLGRSIAMTTQSYLGSIPPG